MRLYTEAVRRNVACLYVTTGNRFEFLFEETAFRQLDACLHRAIAENGLPGYRLLFTVMGNKQAELILTNNKGFWPDGSRHPHSWSIVDNGELVEWLLELE